jgi:hypothetical protein
MKIKTLTRIVLLIIIGTSFAFSAHSAYVLKGSASSSGNDCYVLTPDEGGETGAVWYGNRIDLAYNFDMSFQIYLGSNDFDGADGIAFILQQSGSGAMGGGGGGIGYQGLNSSLAVEFDTYQNDDPEFDHICLQKNGDPDLTGRLTEPVQASAISGNIEDSQWHNIRITWDATTMVMSVYFDSDLRLSKAVNLVSEVFHGNSTVYWGFTGSTGMYSNLQQFCVTSLSFEEMPPEVIPLSPWVLLISIFLILTVTVFRYRRSM